MTLTRRQTLTTFAALPASAVAAGLVPSRAEAQTGGTAQQTAQSFTLGEFRVTTLLAGTTPRDDPHAIFGLNVSDDEFAEVSARNFLPTDVAQFFFTPTLIDTGSDVVLFDTGLNPAGITAALAGAGYAPGDITHVVLTHMHGDHIGGLSDDSGAETFAGAAYITGQAEFDHWAGAGNERFDGKVRPLAERMSFIAPGDDVRTGITAIDGAGHTPGHMCYRIESGGAGLMLIADLANHPVYSLAKPDWEVRFDQDKAAAASARRRILGEIASEKMPMIGYHMPFPALGYVEADGDGFRYVPHSYQLL